MGKHFAKHNERVRQQLINAQENKNYYQNGSEQKNARSESQINRARILDKK